MILENQLTTEKYDDKHTTYLSRFKLEDKKWLLFCSGHAEHQEYIDVKWKNRHGRYQTDLMKMTVPIDVKKDTPLNRGRSSLNSPVKNGEK